MQSSLDVRRIEVADRGYKREDGRLERRNPRKNSQPSLDRADARKQVAGAGGPFQQCHQLALGDLRDGLGRAPWRERVCQYVSISAVAVSLNKKTSINQTVSGNNNISTTN